MPHEHLKKELDSTDLDIVQRLMRGEDIRVAKEGGQFIPASRRSQTAKIVVSDSRNPEQLLRDVSNAVARRDNRSAANVFTDIRRKRQELDGGD